MIYTKALQNQRDKNTTTIDAPLQGERGIVSDAKWNERLAAGLLVIGIVAIGIAPFWLNDLIKPGSEVIVQKLSQLAK